MQHHEDALIGLRGWLGDRVQDIAWSFEQARSEALAVRGQARFTFKWAQERARAEGPLSAPSLDEQVTAALAAKPLDAALVAAAAAKPRF